MIITMVLVVRNMNMCKQQQQKVGAVSAIIVTMIIDGDDVDDDRN